MDRLVVVEPKELMLDFEFERSASALMTIRSVMHTMAIAFNVKFPSRISKRYIAKPLYGIIPPLGMATVEITMLPQSELPNSYPYVLDRFGVQSVLVPGGSSKEVVNLEWFKKMHQVYSDKAPRLVLVGGMILRNMLSQRSMEEIREMLERDVPGHINSADEHGRTPMHLAIGYNRPELVQLLLEFKADLTAYNQARKTALHEAVAAGDPLITELLLANGASSAARTTMGWTALHCAVAAGHCKVVQLLLEHGADVNASCSFGETPLHLAAAQGDLDMVMLLVDRGGNKDAKDCQQKSPLDLASVAGHRELYDTLSLGDALRSRARRGEARLVKRCLQMGALINGADQIGWTALHRAAFKGHHEIVKLLLQTAGCDLERRDQEGYTPLHCAVEGGQKEITSLMIRKGADVNAKNNNGSTSLHIAAALRYNGLIEMLLNGGASKDAKSKDGRTPGDLAQERGVRSRWFRYSHWGGLGKGNFIKSVSWGGTSSSRGQRQGAEDQSFQSTLIQG